MKSTAGERAPGRDGVGGQCNLAGGTKWGRNLAELGQGPCPQHAWGGRAQRWAVSAAGTWRGARPGPCPHHAWAVERSDGLCRPPACGAERGQGPCPHHAWWVAYSEGCVRPACGAERGQGAVSASCLGVAYSEGCKRPACAADSRQGVGSSPWSWSAAFGRLSTAKEVERSSLWAVSAHPALLGGYRGLGSRARLRR